MEPGNPEPLHGNGTGSQKIRMAVPVPVDFNKRYGLFVTVKPLFLNLYVPSMMTEKIFQLFHIDLIE